MHKASAGQFIILYILLILTACGGKQKKEQSANIGINHAKDSLSKVDKSGTTTSLKIDTTIFCADYSAMEDYDAKDSYLTYLKNQKDYFKGKIELSGDRIVKKLFPNLDSIPRDELGSWKTETREYISNTNFYFIGTVLKKPLFTGIVYEEIRDGLLEKYFSTIDPKGNFISRVLIASFLQQGSNKIDEDNWEPNYIQISGCINKGLTISTSEDEHYKYSIRPNGKIVEYWRDYYDSVLTVSPNDAEAHANYARYLKEKHEYANARKQYEQSLKINHGSAALSDEYASFIFDIFHDTLNAKRCYEKTIETSPKVALCYTRYAEFLFYHLKDNENSRIQYEKAIMVAPDKGSLHLDYAITLTEGMHLAKEGRQHYLKAIKLDPELKNEGYDSVFHVK